MSTAESHYIIRCSVASIPWEHSFEAHGVQFSIRTVTKDDPSASGEAGTVVLKQLSYTQTSLHVQSFVSMGDEKATGSTRVYWAKANAFADATVGVFPAAPTLPLRITLHIGDSELKVEKTRIRIPDAHDATSQPFFVDGDAPVNEDDEEGDEHTLDIPEFCELRRGFASWKRTASLSQQLARDMEDALPDFQNQQRARVEKAGNCDVRGRLERAEVPIEAARFPPSVSLTIPSSEETAAQAQQWESLTAIRDQLASMPGVANMADGFLDVCEAISESASGVHQRMLALRVDSWPLLTPLSDAVKVLSDVVGAEPPSAKVAPLVEQCQNLQRLVDELCESFTKAQDDEESDTLATQLTLMECINKAKELVQARIALVEQIKQMALLMSKQPGELEQLVGNVLQQIREISVSEQTVHRELHELTKRGDAMERKIAEFAVKENADTDSFATDVDSHLVLIQEESLQMVLDSRRVGQQMEELEAMMGNRVLQKICNNRVRVFHLNFDLELTSTKQQADRLLVKKSEMRVATQTTLDVLHVIRKELEKGGAKWEHDREAWCETAQDEVRGAVDQFCKHAAFLKFALEAQQATHAPEMERIKKAHGLARATLNPRAAQLKKEIDELGQQQQETKLQLEKLKLDLEEVERIYSPTAEHLSSRLPACGASVPPVLFAELFSHWEQALTQE